MAVPWMQIVRLMPSILDLSRDLLAKTTGKRPAERLEARIGTLEENDRREAELVKAMADQLDQLTNAVTALHRRMQLLLIGQLATGAIAVAALILALR